MAKSVAEQRIILCDIDDVLTFDRTSGGKKERIIDERAIKRLKNLIGKGYHVAFITGKAANYVQANFIPVLKKFGLEGKCFLYGEHGFYKLEGKKIIMTSEGRKFQAERGFVLKEIEKVLRKNGVKYHFPKNDAKLVSLYFKLNDPSPKNKQLLAASVKEVLSNLESSKAIAHKIKFQLTKSGCDIFPSTQSKGNAVIDALKRWKLLKHDARQIAYKDITGRFSGRAYGDIMSDAKMAQGPKLRFYKINKKSPEFLKRTRFLGVKFGSRKLRHKLAKKQRKEPRNSVKRKALKIFRKSLPK